PRGRAGDADGDARRADFTGETQSSTPAPLFQFVRWIMSPVVEAPPIGYTSSALPGDVAAFDGIPPVGPPIRYTPFDGFTPAGPPVGDTSSALPGDVAAFDGIPPAGPPVRRTSSALGANAPTRHGPRWPNSTPVPRATLGRIRSSRDSTRNLT